MTKHELEGRDKGALISEITRLTQAAVDAGLSYTVRLTWDSEWWKVVIQIEEAD